MRIYPDRMADCKKQYSRPNLVEARPALWLVEFNTLSIMRGGARIKCKIKSTIEFIIEILWCSP